MSRLSLFVLVDVLCISLGVPGCSESTLDAITRKPAGAGALATAGGGTPSGGGGGGGAGSSGIRSDGNGTGGAGTGGIGTGAGATGGAATGGAATGGTTTGGIGTGGAGTGGAGTGGAGTGGAGMGGAGMGGAGTGGMSTGGFGSIGGTAQICPSPALAVGDTNETVPVGSLSRSYFLHVPASYDGTHPVPLIVDFHFLGNSGLREQQVSPFPEVTDSEGVIIAFPNGGNGPAGAAWNIGPCCVAQDYDDVAFAKALVAQLQTKACVDPKRIYAVGYGIGGGMAHYAGCHAADVFAGIAPVGFDLLAENSDGCKPTRALTVVFFRELSDAFVPYTGGTWSTVTGMPVTLLGAQATFAKWAEVNQCSGSPTAQDSNGCARYGNCKDGVEVVLCTQEAGLPVPDNGSIAWPILQRHPMP